MSTPPSPPDRESTNRLILALALPITLANLTQPLLSLVDTVLAGHMPGPEFLGGVALGAMVFNFLFWGFGFLRMEFWSDAANRKVDFNRIRGDQSHISTNHPFREVVLQRLGLT